MEKQEKINPAQIFTEYENGVDYKNKIDLYTTVDLNERFYAGDHWYGIESTGVPKPVFNFLRRVLDYLVSAVRSRNVKMVFTPMKFRTAKKTADENVEKTRETNKTEETDKTELLAEALGVK